MKYWEIDGIEGPVSLKTVKNRLKKHPEITGAYLSHWYHDDYVSCDFFSRDEILKTNKRKIESGATAQWETSHRRGDE